MKKGLLLITFAVAALGLVHIYARNKASDPAKDLSKMEQALRSLPDSLLEQVKIEDLIDDEVYIKLAHDGWYQEEIATIMNTALKNKKEAKKRMGYGKYAKQWLPAYGRAPGGDTIYEFVDSTYNATVARAVARVVPEDLLNKVWEHRDYDQYERFRGIRTPGYFRQAMFKPSSGRIHWIAVHPDDVNKIYAVPDGAGIYRTDDMGGSWRCITDNIPVRAHRGSARGYCIPVDPDDFEHVFGFMSSGHIYESFDGGDSWEIVEGATSQHFKRGYAFRDADGNLKFIGCSGNKIYISENKGVSWTIINIPAELQDRRDGANRIWIQQISFDPINRNNIYLPTSRGILYFDDGARSTETNGVKTYNVKRMHFTVYDRDSVEVRRPADYPDDDTMFPLEITQQGFLEVNPEHPNIMYFSGCTGTGGLKSAIYRSRDGGRTWLTMHEPSAGIGRGYVYGDDLPGGWLGGFGVNFKDDNYMYGTAMATGWTTDGGLQFTKSSWGWQSFSIIDGVPYNVSCARHTCDNHFIQSHKSGRLFRGLDAGLITVDKDEVIPGKSPNLWYNIGSNMGQMLFYHVAVNEFGDQAMIGNTQDLDAQTWRYGRWGGWRGYEGSEASFNPYTGAAYFSGGGGGGGQDGSMGLSSWFCRVNRADVSTGSWFMTKRIPQSYRVQLMRIDDIGRHAEMLDQGILAQGLRNMNDVMICRDKGRSTIYLMLWDNSIVRSVDGGFTFEPVLYDGQPAKFSSSRPVCDPDNSDIMYLGQKGRVLKYYINESRYEPITSEGLPNIDCNQLLFHEGSGDMYFVNNNTAGIYILENGASSWRYWVKGFNGGKFSGNVSINYTSQELVFSDGGRGVWVADLEHPSDRFFTDGFGLKEHSNIDGTHTIGIDTNWTIPLYYNYRWTVNGADADCPYQYLTRRLNPGDKVQLHLTLRESPDVHTASAEYTVADTAPAPFVRRAGNAVYSDGQGRIDLGLSDYFFKDFTLELWLKPMGNGVIAANSQGTSRNDSKGWLLYLDAGTLRFSWAPRNIFSKANYEPAIVNDSRIGGGTLKLGEWAHVAVTAEREGNVSLYVNGVRTATAARGLSDFCLNGPTLSLLGDVIEQSNMEAYADELKIWNRALTADELRAEMFAANGSGADGLVAYYNFNGSGTVLDNDIELFSQVKARKRTRAQVTHPRQFMALAADRSAYAAMTEPAHTFACGDDNLVRVTLPSSGAQLGVYSYESSQWKDAGDNLSPLYYEPDSRGYYIHSFGGTSPDDMVTLDFYPGDTPFDPDRTYRLYVDDPAEQRIFWHEHDWSTLEYDADSRTLKATDIPASILFDKKLLVVALKPAIELNVQGLNEHHELNIYNENRTTRTVNARTVQGQEEPIGDYPLLSDSPVLKASQPLNFQKGTAQTTLTVDMSALGQFNTPVSATLRGNDPRMIPMRVDVINRITPPEIGASATMDDGGLSIGDARQFKGLDGCNTVTMMTWVRIDTIPAEGVVPLMMFGNYNANGSMGLVIHNRRLRIKWNNSGATYNAQAFTEADYGRWMHVAVVFSPKITYTYINGTCQQSNFTFNGFTAAAPLQLGMLQPGDKSFHGAFDQAAVWNRVLSQEEIVKYMHSSVPMDDANLLAYVNMDDYDTEGALRDAYSLGAARSYGNVTTGTPSTAPYRATGMYNIESPASPIAIAFPEGRARQAYVTSFKGMPHNYFNAEYSAELPLNEEFYTIAYAGNDTAADGETLTLTYRHPSLVEGDSVSVLMRPMGVAYEFSRHISAAATAAENAGDGITAQARFDIPYAAMDSACEVMFLTKNLGSERPVRIVTSFAGGFEGGKRYMLSKDDNRIPVTVTVRAGDPSAIVRLNLRETEYAALDNDVVDMSAAESRHYIAIDRDKINRRGINTLTINTMGASTDEQQIEFYLEPEVRLSLANGDAGSDYLYVARQPVSTLDIRVELVDGYLEEDVALETSADVSSSMNIGNGSLLLDQAVSYPGLQHHASPVSQLHEGWNLLGNPYLANINLTKRQNVEFDPADVTKFVYAANPATGNFMAYDMTDYDDEQSIPPFGAYYVQTLAGNPLFTVTPTAKEVEISKRTFDFYALKETPMVKLQLTDADGNELDRTTVLWNEDAATTFVTNEDAHKIMSLNPAANEMYTLTADNVPSSINDAGSDAGDIPVVVKAGTPGTMKLRATGISGLGDGVTVRLTDRATGAGYMLDDGGSGYAFTADTPGDISDRFAITLDRGSQVGMDDLRLSGYGVYVATGSCIVTGLRGDATVSFFDPAGKLIMRSHTTDDRLEVSLDQGVYMVRIRENNKDYATKIAIK